jgi:hypothetical protein
MKLINVLLFGFATGAFGHGRLTKPLSRKGPGYENDPVPGRTSEKFVCRHAARNTAIDYHQVTAGAPIVLQWDFSAAHVGDCAVYITYDVDKALTEQQYFKIANLPKCRAQNRQDVSITAPDFLPAGKAILRWDWWGLHQFPSNAEFYTQCVDIDITAGTSPTTVAQLATYSIIDPPIMPANARDGVGYRNPFNPGADQFMTGPACANGYTGNDCALTAKGTTGYTGGGDAPVGGGGSAEMHPDKTGPTVAPGQPTPEPPAMNCEIYTVVAGDTMAGIAAKFNAMGKKVTFEEICAANGKQLTCGFIDVGDTYLIPYEGNTCSQAAIALGGGVEAVVLNITNTNPPEGTVASASIESASFGVVTTLAITALSM